MAQTFTTDRYEILMYLSGLMKSMGIPASILGYYFLQDSVMLALYDRAVLRSVTKVLYPSIAKTHETTPSRVERSMRHAIETAWQRGDINVLASVFGYTVNSSKGKPTNSEFISIMTEHVRLNLRID